MDVELPIEVEIKAQASSTYTLADVLRRLAELGESTDPAAIEEREFLERLKRDG